MSRLTQRYLRNMEDSSDNAANKEHLDNFKRDVVNALRRMTREEKYIDHGGNDLIQIREKLERRKTRLSQNIVLLSNTEDQIAAVERRIKKSHKK